MNRGGGGGGGMFQGVRGMHAGGMHSPTTDNLTDENILGKAYDNKVVMRLFSYLSGNYKHAILSLIAVIIYTIANVCIP